MKTETVVENGFKETEIGLIPKDWDIDKLGKYCEVFSGYAFKSSDFAEKGVLIVKIGNLQEGTIVVDNRTNYYPKAIDESLEKFVLKREDILIALTGATTGKVAVVPEKFEGSLLNQRVGKFNIFNKKLDSSFFRFFSITSRFQDDIKGNILKSAQGNVSPKKIEQLTIILPAFSEQQKTAFVLSKIQKAIEQQDKIIGTTKGLKKSIMNKLFTEGLHGEEQKETEIGLMPKSWRIVELEDICRPKKEIVIPEGKGKYIYVGLEHMETGEIWLKSHGYDNEVRSAKFKFNESDVLYGKLRPYLDKAALPNLSGICSTDIIVLTPNSKIAQHLLIYILHLTNFIEYAKATTSGTNHPRTSWNSLKRYKLALPSIKEQKEIANIILNVDKKISQAESKKQSLQALFKTMLKQLMTGKVRVKDLDFEVKENV